MGGEVPNAVEPSPHIDEALKYLHVTRPERVIAAHERAGRALAGLGLDPPALTVIRRVADSPEVVLLPRHIADAWERGAARP